MTKWNGIPPNPTVENWYWLESLNEIAPAKWEMDDDTGNYYWNIDARTVSAKEASKYYTYQGRCYTPEQLEDKVRAEHLKVFIAAKTALTGTLNSESQDKIMEFTIKQTCAKTWPNITEQELKAEIAYFMKEVKNA